MKYMMKLVALVSSLVCLASAKTNITSDLEYDCMQNGTIRVYGKNLTAHGSIYAVGENDSLCTVSNVSTDKTQVIFEISVCNVTKPINVTIMSVKQKMSIDSLVGGRISQIYELQCNGVPVGGVKVHEHVHLNESSKPASGFNQHHQAEHNLTMTIHKNNDSSVDEAVTISEHLKLVIAVANGFQTFVESCNATDKDAGGNHTKLLALQGHTLDEEILTNFTFTKKTSRYEMVAHLYAFHFISTHYIRIDCEITLCAGDDMECSFNITQNQGTQRRRRDTASLEQTMTLSTTLRVVDRPLEKDNDWKASAGARGSEYGLVLTILCTVISATSART